MKFLRHIALVMSSFCLFFATSATAQNSPCFWQGSLVKCFPTTGLYLDNSRSLRLGTNDTTHYVELKAANSIGTNYTETFPAAVGGSGSVLYHSNNSGQLAFLAVGTEGKSLRSISGAPAYAWQETTAAKSADYVITDSDGFTTILVTTGASTRTITLPTAASPNVGRQITIKKVDVGAATGKITIATTSAQTVDGWTTSDIGVGTANDGAYMTVVSDGTSWYVTALGGETYDDSFATGYTASQASTSMITRTLPAGTWKLEVSGWALTISVSTGSNWFYDLYVNAATGGFLGQDQIASSQSLAASQNYPVGNMMEVVTSTSTIAIVLKGSLTRASGTCYLYANMLYTRIR